MDPSKNQSIEFNFLDSIDKKFIFDLDESITHQQIEKLNDDGKFRVFRIKPSTDINALLDKIQGQPFKTAFAKPSHLFVFIIETSEVLADYSLVMEAIESYDTEACNQLWITTRSQLREDTEQQLKQSANPPVPLTEGDETKVITEHLARSSISNETNSGSMGNPLRVQMIAKLHDGETTQAMKALNLFSIYEEFSKKKAKKWILNRGEFEIDQDNALTSFFKVHQRIALKNLLDPDFADIDVESEGWTNEMIASVGMVHLPSAETTQFVHKIFAEFFVAQFIIDKLKLGELDPEDKTLMEKVFSQVLTFGQHRKIRTFIDKGLENEKNRGVPAATCDQIAHNLIEAKECVEILYKSLAEQHQFLFRFIFNCLELNRSASIDGYLRFDTEESWKIYKLVDIIVQNMENPTDHTTTRMVIMQDDEFKMLEAKGFKMNSPWQNLISLNSFEGKQYEEMSSVLLELCTNEHLKCQLIKQKSENGKNILSFMAINANDNLSDLFWEALREVFDLNKLKVFLLEETANGANALHLALSCNDDKFLKGLLQVVKSVLDFEEQKTFLRRCDNKGGNILLYAVKNGRSVLPTLWSYFEESLLENEFKLLLKDKRCNGQNILHSMINENYERLFKEFFSVLHKVFNDEEMKCYLSEKDGMCGRNVLCLLAGSSHVTFLGSFWTFLQRVFNKNELKALLVDDDDQKFNVLFIAVARNDKNFVRALFQIIEETLDREEMKSLLQKSNYYSSSILHCVALNKRHMQVLTTLWTSFKESSLENVFKSLMNHKDSDGKNMLFFLIAERNLTMFQELVIILPDVFTKQELKRYLIETKSRHEHNILSMMVQFSNKEFFEVLWKFVQEVLDINELKALIFGTDCVGSNALHNAIFFNNDFIIEALFEIIRKILSPQEQETFLQVRFSNNSNILHLVNSHNVNASTLMTLWKCFKEHSLIDVFKSLMNYDIKRLIHSIVISNKTKSEEWKIIMREMQG